GLRPHEGHEDCCIIDLVDNCTRNRLVTAPVLFGLPESLDVGGKRIDKVREKVDASGLPVTRLEGLRGLDDLQHKMEEWDLFGAVELPKDVQRLTDRIWVPWGEGYHLKLRDGREARIEQNAAGHFTATFVEKGRQMGVRQMETLEEAFRTTDRAIEKCWGRDESWTMRKAPWVREPPTERQLKFLRWKRVPPELLVGLSKGKAAAMIDRIILKEKGEVDDKR